jgi:ABC-type multidrug transport system fused ATPase/permease subunit
MTTEERGEGAVSGDVWRSYMRAAKNPALVLMILASFVFANSCQQFQQWVIVAWTGDASYKKMAMTTYLLGVTAMATGVAFFNWLRTYLACILGAEASRTMHHDLAQKVLAAPLSFFESTPVGRLLQRFTKDLDLIDQQLPGSFGQFIASTLNILASLVAIVFVTPSFAAVLGPLVFVYILVTNYYRGVARELKRLDSLSRSPVFAHFSETLGGLSTIRSYRRQGMFSSLNEVKLEDNLAAYYALKVVDRWLSVRLELLGNLVVFAAALLAVWSGSRSGPSGLSLNNALSTTSLLNWAVRNGAETESLMNSVERVLYTTRSTPQEAATYVDHYATPPLLHSAKDATQLPSNDTELLVGGWPWNGGIKFTNCIMRYRDDFQPVLQGISLAINPGENVGIVGRTGSGKSSLFRALLRLTELEGGHITIDGVDIRSVGLDALRSSIAIIPQDPVLFSGSVRYVLYTQSFCVPSSSPHFPFSHHHHQHHHAQIESRSVQHQKRRCSVGRSTQRKP